MDGDQGESSFLQLFWDLASVEEAEQLCAARKVILALKQQQVRAGNCCTAFKRAVAEIIRSYSGIEDCS